MASTTASKSKSILTEVHTVKRFDNSRLVRHVEPAKMKNLYKTAGLGALVAFFCMMYVYQHFRCIDLSFQLEDVKGKQEAAAALNSKLKVEVAGLRDPKRIDYIAQHTLGLTQASPAQVREYQVLDGAQVAAAHYVQATRRP